jgi:hypothetical protein
MTDTPRYRAEVRGHFVQLFSRNPKTTTVQWHSRFKAEYHTLRNARAAKEKYEACGKILWPDGLRASEGKREVPGRTPQNQQEELRV